MAPKVRPTLPHRRVQWLLDFQGKLGFSAEGSPATFSTYATCYNPETFC